MPPVSRTAPFAAVHHPQPHRPLAAQPHRCPPQISTQFTAASEGAVAAAFHSRPCSSMSHRDAGAELRAGDDVPCGDSASAGRGRSERSYCSPRHLMTKGFLPFLCRKNANEVMCKTVVINVPASGNTLRFSQPALSTGAVWCDPAVPCCLRMAFVTLLVPRVGRRTGTGAAQCVRELNSGADLPWQHGSATLPSCIHTQTNSLVCVPPATLMARPSIAEWLMRHTVQPLSCTTNTVLNKQQLKVSLPSK